MGSWNTEPGLNHVGAYQVSGKPFATGSLNCKVDAQPMEGCVVNFPYVTSWVKIVNKDPANTVRVGFSISGVTGSFNFFEVGKASTANVHNDSGMLDFKVSSIVLSGSTTVDVVAGLTNIRTGLTATAQGANWSGSVGVG
tara:strand:+ start:139 stop:558 length:420 start_codon:yes stop_codon:yes gene_type:complete